MKSSFLILISACFLMLAGCSNKQDSAGGQAKEEAEETVKVKVSEKQDKEENSLLESIEKVVIPGTIEDFAASKPGEITKDFSYESETALWPKLNALEGIEDVTKTHMESVIKETDDMDLLFKSLIYYLGNSAYGEVLDRVISIKPDFDEPFLPEPEEMTAEGKSGQKPPGKALILLDASSSMLLESGGQQKMAAAKSAVRRFAKTIGASSDVSLFVYGHAGTQEDKDKELSCSKVDEIYPMKPYNEESFFKAVEEVEAKGWTPLAEAIKTAREASTSYEGELTVYIVSDGAETCDGNPVEEAKRFVQNHESRKVNIIGFDVDQKAESQLKEVALAGNGEYIPADSPDDLGQSIEEKWMPGYLDIISKQWASPKNTFPVAFQKLEIDKRTQTITYAINQEYSRLLAASRLLKSEGLITEEQEAELTKIIESHKEKLKGLSQELAEKKKQEIDEEVERIDQKIKDWSERMEKIRAELNK